MSIVNTMRRYILIVAFSILYSMYFLSCSPKRDVILYSWTDGLRVRSEANINSKILLELKKDERLIFLNKKQGSYTATIDGIKTKGEWLNIKTTKNVSGWVFSGGIECIRSTDSLMIEKRVKQFSDFSIEKRRFLYLPVNNTANLYTSPHTGSKLVRTVNGPYCFVVSEIRNISYPCLGIQKNWITHDYYNSKFQNIHVYLLSNNLINQQKYISIMTSKINDFKKKITELNNKLSFISKKQHRRGDAGQSWLEHAKELLDKMKHDLEEVKKHLEHYKKGK